MTMIINNKVIIYLKASDSPPGEESTSQALPKFEDIPDDEKIFDKLSKFSGTDRVAKTSAVISEFNPILPNRSHATLYGDYWENDSVEDLIARWKSFKFLPDCDFLYCPDPRTGSTTQDYNTYNLEYRYEILITTLQMC